MKACRIKLLAPDLVNGRSSLQLVSSQTIQFTAIHVDAGVLAMVPCKDHAPICTLPLIADRLNGRLVGIFLVGVFFLLWGVGIWTAKEWGSSWHVDVDWHDVLLVCCQ